MKLINEYDSQHFQKKIWNIDLKSLMLIITVSIVAIYVAISISAFISNMRTNTGRHAAIMISNYAIKGNENWAPPLALLGSYPAWNFYFNDRGLKTDYFLGATKQDFINVLKTDKYESIVLIAHGSCNEWRAADGFIDNFDILSIKGQFKRKNGEWFQRTCPAQSFSTTHLGELVMSNSSVYYYNGDKVDTYDFVLDAVTGFWHIKNELSMRKQHTSH